MSFIQVIAAQNDPKLLLTGTDRWSISGSGTAASPYSGNSTNQFLNNTTATVTFFTVGYGTLNWNIIVSSEPIFDVCRLIIDGVTIFTISGNNVQRIGSQPVPSNTIIQVSYSKDGSVFQGTDTATINSLSFT